MPRRGSPTTSMVRPRLPHGLMGLPEPDVRVAILKAPPRRPARPSTQVRVATGRQTVLVERRAPRALIR